MQFNSMQFHSTMTDAILGLPMTPANSLLKGTLNPQLLHMSILKYWKSYKCGQASFKYESQTWKSSIQFNFTHLFVTCTIQLFNITKLLKNSDNSI